MKSMPRQRSTQAAQAIVDDAQAMLSLDLVADLAEPLARYVLQGNGQEDGRDGPEAEALGRVAALFEARGREVPRLVRKVLEKGFRDGPSEVPLHCRHRS